MRRIYLDANATTPLLPEVLEAMRPFLLEQFGNASSIHQEGQHARWAVEQARASVARFLSCRPSEIVFTSGGTESDNLAIFGSVKPGDHVITSKVEHHAVLHAGEKLRERGVDVDFLPVNGQGVVAPEEIRQALRPNTRLISVMMANNETGVLQPVNEIGQIAAEAGVRFHVDAVQAAGKLPLEMDAIGCHLLTISGHKMHAPQGTGALSHSLQAEPTNGSGEPALRMWPAS
jgi:cysteine desulfurase